MSRAYGGLVGARHKTTVGIRCLGPVVDWFDKTYKTIEGNRCLGPVVDWLVQDIKQ